MQTKKRNSVRATALFLALILTIGMLPATAFAGSNPVVTDSTDFDVFMNVDPTLGINPTDFKTKVSNYLDYYCADYSIGSDTLSYRINTSAATIDPTDLTKWEVYDHYDTAQFANEAAWKTNYHGGIIPENWYYAPVTDSHVAGNEKTSLPVMLSDKAGTTSTGTHWGNTAGLVEHIYSYLENHKPAMQFYGYGSSDWADFLYYPASATSSKSVKFDVDASNVIPHSLQYAGFLINTGTKNSGSSKTIDGYVILFEYGPAGSSSAATSLISVKLYKLSDVNVDSLHAHGLKAISQSATAGWTLVNTSSFATLYSKSHIELSITKDELTATIQQLDNSGNLTGSKSYLFGSAGSPIAITNTGFGGFGPYVDYGVTGHNCTNTSAFRYSNLEMSFAESLSGSSALEAYKFANYLNDSQKKFFVNLTADGQSYNASATDTDKAYLSLMNTDKTMLITDEYEGTYLKDTLGNNAKSVYDINHVTDSDISAAYSGSDATEKLAAKVAWLIFHSSFDKNVTVTPPSTVAIASLLLLDSAPGTEENPWDGAKQVNQIKKELIPQGGLNVYLNPDNSQNASGLSATYTLTDPKGTTKTITTIADGDHNNKLYFIADDTVAALAGDYKVTLSYAVGGSVSSTVPGTATFTVLTDTKSPSASASISNGKASLTFNNSASTTDNSYTSDLDSYATVLNTSSAKPATPSTFNEVTGNSALVNLDDGLTPGTTYYIHMFLKDAAGNIGYTSQSFTINAPTIAFSTPAAANTYNSSNRYTGNSVSFSMTPGTYPVAAYKIGLGDSAPTYDASVSASGNTPITYTLPTGAYRIWIAAIDTKGNVSNPVSLYVNAKKFQVLNGTKSYTFEAGKDSGATLDYTSSSSPSLAEGESLPAITYDETSDPNDAITVSSIGVLTVGNRVGTATITAIAAGTATHREATDQITVRVVRPFSVSLVTSAYHAASGVTIVPGYLDEGSFGLGSARELKYREVGTSDWTTIPAANWVWNTGYTIPFAGLKSGAEYEVLLSGQNNRATPTTDTASLNFKTPEAAGTHTGTGTITLEDTDNGEPYYVAVQKGDTVLYSDTVTGTGANIDYHFTNLPDGFYNVVVKYGDDSVTKLLEIKNGEQVSPPISAKLIGSKNTQVRMKDSSSPKVAVNDLSGLYDTSTSNTDDSAGITAADNAILTAGGSALIELVSTGLKEEDIPTDIAKINEIKSDQKLAMVLDLSMFKTVWENNTANGHTNRMTSTPERIVVAIPLNDINRNGLKLYRVHESAAQLIPEAISSSGGIYCWKNDYTLPGPTTLTKGAIVGANDEFVEFTNDYAVLHVMKFSTYAIGYTPQVNSSSSISKTSSVTMNDADHGKVTTKSTSQSSGNKVVLTVTPDEGYVLNSLSIRDTNGKEISYTKISENTYQFIMPSSAVKVSAEFKKSAETAVPASSGVEKLLNTQDHISYMIGDDKGYFNPDKNMTRAEAAQMFYNLLLDKNVSSNSKFSDIAENAWYGKAVETLASLGIITGYDGAYLPNQYITREEFTAIAMRFAAVTDGKADFTDVSKSSWAYQSIMSAAGYGWIKGYEDGTFKPQGLITRAEVVTIVNNMLSRNGDKSFINQNSGSLKLFPDVKDTGYWGYYGIIEATNGHQHSSSDDKESWTSVN